MLIPSSGRPAFTVLNSLFRSSGSHGVGTVVEHSDLEGSWSVGNGSLVSSVRSIPGIIVRDGIAVQVHKVVFV
jgi:hypothetical protein